MPSITLDEIQDYDALVNEVYTKALTAGLGKINRTAIHIDLVQSSTLRPSAKAFSVLVITALPTNYASQQVFLDMRAGSSTFRSFLIATSANSNLEVLNSLKLVFDPSLALSTLASNAYAAERSVGVTAYERETFFPDPRRPASIQGQVVPYSSSNTLVPTSPGARVLAVAVNATNSSAESTVSSSNGRQTVTLSAATDTPLTRFADLGAQALPPLRVSTGANVSALIIELEQ